MNPWLRSIFDAVNMRQLFEEFNSLEDAVGSFDEDWECGNGIIN